MEQTTPQFLLFAFSASPRGGINDLHSKHSTYNDAVHAGRQLLKDRNVLHCQVYDTEKGIAYVVTTV